MAFIAALGWRKELQEGEDVCIHCDILIVNICNLRVIAVTRDCHEIKVAVSHASGDTI